MFQFPPKGILSFVSEGRGVQFSLPVVVVCALTVGTCCVGCHKNAEQSATDTPASQVSPTVIAASATLGDRISKALTSEPKLRGTSISVGVSNLDGTVSLSGTVAQAAQEKLAIRLAQAEAKKAKVVSWLQIARSVTSPDKIKMHPAEPKKR